MNDLATLPDPVALTKRLIACESITPARGGVFDVLEAALYEESAQHTLYEGAGGQRAEFAIGQLRMMQHAAIQPGLIPLSSEMEEGQADVLSFAQNIFGGMSDARDGFAGDIEHER